VARKRELSISKPGQDVGKKIKAGPTQMNQRLDSWELRTKKVADIEDDIHGTTDLMPRRTRIGGGLREA